MTNTVWKWLGVLALVTVVDLFVRFTGSFDLRRILAVEAFLFPAAGLVFLKLLWEGPTQTGWIRKLQILTIASFFLAGLRSGLWAVGLPIGTVNLSVLAAVVLAWVGFKLWRRSHS